MLDALPGPAVAGVLARLDGREATALFRAFPMLLRTEWGAQNAEKAAVDARDQVARMLEAVAARRRGDAATGWTAFGHPDLLTGLERYDDHGTNWVVIDDGRKPTVLLSHFSSPDPYAREVERALAAADVRCRAYHIPPRQPRLYGR